MAKPTNEWIKFWELQVELAIRDNAALHYKYAIEKLLSYRRAAQAQEKV